MSSSTLRLALIQLSVGAQKAANLTAAAAKVREAAAAGAQLVSLPECFNSPYGTSYFPEYAESVPQGDSCAALEKMARDNKVYLVGGSIPERDDAGQLYNTTTVWSPEGQLLAKYRKMHLFDIDVPGKITFKESDALTPGNQFASFDTPWAKVGLGICYDIRFAEMAHIYAREGCSLLLYPGAFNMATGPAHWELLARARALDSQLFVATTSPARDEGSKYVAWGHSTAVDPWGTVIAKAGHGEEVVMVDLDLDYMKQVRSQIPITVQRRSDMYQLGKVEK